MRYLGIDLGTSFIKAAFLDLDTLSLGPVQRVASPPPLPGFPPLRKEFDPDTFVNATRQLVRDLLAESPDCAGLLISSQMGGLILLNETGRPLSNYISWQDRRLLEPHPSGGGSHDEILGRRLTADDWRDLGREIWPGSPLSLLFWLQETGALPAQTPLAATLPDFVLAQLCGIRPATHPTCAVGALNILTGDWHHALLDRLGLGAVRWPLLREIHQPIGQFVAGSRRLPCFPPVGDHPCALAGALLDFDELSLNIATGSQVSLRSPTASPGDYQTIPFFDGQFLHRISHLPAGRALDALVRLLSELAQAQGLPLADPWPDVIRAAENAPPGDLRAHLAFFPGPVGDSGSFTNLREENLTVGQLFRAAFFDMADNYHRSALRLSPAEAWRTLVFSGGLAQKLDLLRRLIAEKFQCPARLAPVAEDTLQGLLVLALVASRRAPSVHEAMRALRQGPAGAG